MLEHVLKLTKHSWNVKENFYWVSAPLIADMGQRGGKTGNSIQKLTVIILAKIYMVSFLTCLTLVAKNTRQ